MIETITSVGNPLVKLARSLHHSKARGGSGLFLVEGIHLVGEAIVAGWTVEWILYAPDLLSSPFALDLISRQSDKGIRCQPVSEVVFRSLAEKENPQGILAGVQQRRYSLGATESGDIRNAVALVRPQDPGNIGAILRTVDGVGADALFLLDGGADQFHPSAVRASMGAIFWKPAVEASFVTFGAWARRRGLHLVGASAQGQLDYLNVRMADERWVLVLGSEQKGLSATQAMTCDELVRIPMHGRASSLNLAVAAGILLYHLKQSRP
jgi:TrmH family RNA methyltransferase